VGPDLSTQGVIGAGLGQVSSNRTCSGAEAMQVKDKVAIGRGLGVGLAVGFPKGGISDLLRGYWQRDERRILG
jgi:hypothetical protein